MKLQVKFSDFIWYNKYEKKDSGLIVKKH